jgi:hypothetical protein
VLEKPSFVEVPEDQELFEEEDIEVVCKATGRELPTIAWFHNNKELVGSDGVMVESYQDPQNDCTTSVVTIKNAQPKAHSGKYRMDATNKAGTVKHETKIKGTY